MLKVRTVSGPSAALGQARGPSAAARTGWGGRALRPHDQLYPCVTYEIHVQNWREKGGVQKNRILENIPILISLVKIRICLAQ